VSDRQGVTSFRLISLSSRLSFVLIPTFRSSLFSMLKSLIRLSSHHQHHRTPLLLRQLHPSISSTTRRITSLPSTIQQRQTRSLMTITDPSQYKSNAPSPYVVHSGASSRANELLASSKPLNGYTRVEEKDGKPGYLLFDEQIEQSPNDDKTYR